MKFVYVWTYDKAKEQDARDREGIERKREATILREVGNETVKVMTHLHNDQVECTHADCWVLVSESDAPTPP